jgi:hypothetical protein
MATALLRRTSLVALGLAALLVACDKSPTNQPPQPPPPSGPATLLRIDLTGPASVPPNGTAQFTSRAFYSDGSQRDVTAEATWRAGQTSILTIDAAGVATGRAMGETSITATFSGRSTTKSDIVVVPEGTYRVMGNITDAGVMVSDADIRVMSGPSQGLSTKTLVGTYRLYGVTGDSEIRVTKAGYEEARRRLVVSRHERVDFALTLSNPRDDVAGTYTLKVTASDECRSMLPAEAMSRSYQAVITQNGPRLQVKLQGATFYRSGNLVSDHFVGTVEATRVTFQINGPSSYYSYYYNPDILEQLSNSLFGFFGTAVTTASAGGRSGPLNGQLAIYSTGLRQQAGCTSAGHRFELTR